ncbi:MAG: 4Fe-4S binding protein [Candidatus Bathyarchaeia archaeon]|jgi:polyferredoxin
MAWQYIGDILRLIVLGGLGAAGILTVLIWKKNLATKVTFIRLVVQAMAFAAFFYVFTLTIPLLYFLIAIFAVTIVFGRLYCGWFCPFGFIMDLEVMLRKAFGVRYRNLPERLNVALHKSRYALVVVFLALPIAAWILNPPQNLSFAAAMVPLLAGPFRPWTVLIDPLIPVVVPWTTSAVKVFQVNFSYPYVQDVLFWVGKNVGLAVAVAFVALTLVGSFFFRRLWCRFCPTGASLAVVNRFKGFKWSPLLHIEKDEEKCTKCGVCKRVCQTQVTEVYEKKGGKIDTSMCMLCLRCAEMCPYADTLKVKLGNKTVFKSRNWLEPPTVE